MGGATGPAEAGCGAKARHYAIALASAGEAAAAIDAAAALGLSPREELQLLKALVGRLGALLAGLLRSVRRQSTASRRSSSSTTGSVVRAPT